MKKSQSGFTLIEMAIVLVIIGLLIGGVLKGQEMINNAKLKRIAADFEGIAAAIYSYQDRYRALPGDDAQATVRWGAGITVGNANGVVLGNWDSVTNTDETRIFWQHLRNSNLTSGPLTGATSYAQPINAYGGMIGVQNGNYAMTGMVVCMAGLTSKDAEIIDTQMDDGIAATGNVRSNTTNVAAAGAANYTAVTSYSVCRKL